MASSLSAFLEVMYKKRELEYKAALAQSEADVKGAESIGQGISNIGGAIGSIGKGIGSYMQQSQLDKSAMAIGQEEGVPLTSKGFGASRELDQRIAAGQFRDASDQGMTPYQRSNLDLAVEREKRIRFQGLQARSDAADRSATKSYKDSIANTDAYQANSTANMAKLYDADSPEQFSVFQAHQTSLNQGAAKAGINPELIQKYAVPKEFIPKSTDTEDMPSSYRRYPEPSYSPSIGVVNQRTTGVDIPPGAIPIPGFNRPAGTKLKYQGKPYVWNGSYAVPRMQ